MAEKTKRKERKPELRFKGFDEEWEERALIDFVTFSKGRGYSKNDLTDTGIPVILYGRLYTKYQTLISEVDTFVQSGENAVYSKGTEVIIPASGESAEDIARASAVSLKDCILGGDLNILQPSCEVKSTFLALSISNGDAKKELVKSAQGKSVVHLHNADLEKISINLPSVAEQERVVEHILNLENLISHQQKKYTHLQNLKKAMLEKMFPREGADVPEVRFKGFEGAWERHTVGEYYNFKNGLNKGKEYFGTGTPIVNFTDVYHNRGIYSQNLKGTVTLSPDEIKNYEVKKGDIFFTRTSETIEEIGYPSVMLDMPEKTVFSGFVLRGRTILADDPLNDLFKKYVFFTDVFRNEMMRKSSMTTRALTSGTSIKGMEFTHPISKAEQEKIGSYLTHLDSLISNQQKKINHLKHLKSALLEKMFVSEKAA